MTIPPQLTDKGRGTRLQKVMAAAGVASRRHCEQLIAQGRVRVNRQTVDEMPAWVNPQRDVIEVEGRRLPGPSHARPLRNTRDPQSPRSTYLALHKPRRVVTTTDDERGRRTVLDLVDPPAPGGHPPRLFPVGRLDAESTGLILLTDDGDLAQCLTHPRYGVSKRYEVSVRGRLTQEDVDRMQRGLFLAPRGGRAKPTAAKAKRAAARQVKIVGHERDRARGDRTRLTITLTEGRNREIRRMIARLGYRVRRLKRTAIGPVTLGGLGPGQWRVLRPAEVRALSRRGA